MAEEQGGSGNSGGQSGQSDQGQQGQGDQEGVAPKHPSSSTPTHPNYVKKSWDDTGSVKLRK